jgi:hypothetical protein
MKNKKILVLPGWMKEIKLYKEDRPDFSFHIGDLDKKSLEAEYLIGYSLGALAILDELNNFQGKVILVNPPLPKKDLYDCFGRWLNYNLTEGLFKERQRFTINPYTWLKGFLECIFLLSTDFSNNLKTFPKERIVVIRGKRDTYFCNDEAQTFLDSMGIKTVLVESGHNWNLEIEEAMDRLIT